VRAEKYIRDASGWRKDVTDGNDNGTDGQTDGQTDRVRRNMWPPPREEGRIIMNISMWVTSSGEPSSELKCQQWKNQSAWRWRTTNVQMAPLCFPGLKGNHWLGMSQSLTPIQSHDGESPVSEKQNRCSLMCSLNAVNDEAEVTCSGIVVCMFQKDWMLNVAGEWGERRGASTARL